MKKVSKQDICHPRTELDLMRRYGIGERNIKQEQQEAQLNAISAMLQSGNFTIKGGTLGDFQIGVCEALGDEYSKICLYNESIENERAITVALTPQKIYVKTVTPWTTSIESATWINIVKKSNT